MATSGRFIVIEGTDGSGKTTHTKLLVEWLSQRSHDIAQFNFPTYHQPAAYFVEQYLNGKYGQLADIGPYRASLFYALERFDAARALRAALDRGAMVVCDRYMGSNLGHQGAKITDPDERRSYYEWDLDLEYNILGIPKPDLNIVLHIPSEQGRAFVDQRAKRGENTGAKVDLHEADLEHLKQAGLAFREVCQIFPESFRLIECTSSQGVRSIDDIQAQIRRMI